MPAAASVVRAIILSPPIFATIAEALTRAASVGGTPPKLAGGVRVRRVPPASYATLHLRLFIVLRNLKIAALLTFGTMCEPQTNVATMSSSESPPPQKERLPHSKWGVLSFKIAVFAFVTLCVYYCICFVVFQIVPEIFTPISVGLTSGGFLLYIFASVAAVIFGILGVCQSRTRKMYSILGILSFPIGLLASFLMLVSFVRLLPTW